MTARDTLRAMLDDLSESEAAELIETLRYIAAGRPLDRDALDRFRALLGTPTHLRAAAAGSSAAAAWITVCSDAHRDSLDELLDNAPLDDEPTTPEEEAAVQEALDAAARGETMSLDELRAELR